MIENSKNGQTRNRSRNWLTPPDETLKASPTIIFFQSGMAPGYFTTANQEFLPALNMFLKDEG
jgi:hypothetical protein